MRSNVDDRRLRPAMVVGSILGGAALAAGLAIFGAVSCSTSDIRSGLSGPEASSPEAVIAELKDQKAKIDSISDQMAERVKAFNATRKPGEPTVDLGQVFADDLSGPERDVLTTMLDSEKDVSYRALLKSIVDDRDTIRGLQEKVLRLEQGLPDQFVVASKGDSQYDLAMNYLTAKAGLDRPRAERILSRIELSDELVPGNKVWFFYDADRDAFRTYITQGEAGQMPIALRRAIKRKLVADNETLTKDLETTREQMQSQVASLSSQIDDLKSRRDGLASQVFDLTRTQARLQGQVAELTSRENSVFYHTATQKELREQGVVTPILKRFRDVKDVRYDQSLDLTQGNHIRLEAAALGLDKIGKVELLPSVFQPERDYTIERSEDGAEATLVILDPEIFRGKEVILSVKG